VHPRLAHITDWIFDLDNTLYRADANFFKQIDVKMTDFISRYLSLESEAASLLRKNVGTHLNLFDLFDGSFGIEDADYIPKPKRETYEIFNRIYNVNPKHAIFFEDNVFNLEVPKEMGMVTVLVTSDADFSDAPEVVRPSGQTTTAHWVDYATHDLPKWLSEFTA